MTTTTRSSIASPSLAALREDNPRDFLAALGLLRLIDHRWPETHPELRWHRVRGTPELTFADPLPADWSRQLHGLLLQWHRHEPNPFGHGKIESISPDEFRALLRDGLDNRDFFSIFYPALAGQIPQEKVGRRSEFIIESASRSVLKGVDDILVDEKHPLDLEIDLSGSGIPFVVSNTSRWNPAEYQSAALSAADPQHNKRRDPRSLNILALFGLTFYPAVDTAGGRRTPGFRRVSGRRQFSWPVWSEPLGTATLSSLLHHPAVHSDPGEPAILRGLGVRQVWRSRKFSPDGKNDYFSTAEPGL